MVQTAKPPQVIPIVDGSRLYKRPFRKFWMRGATPRVKLRLYRTLHTPVADAPTAIGAEATAKISLNAVVLLAATGAEIAL